MSIVLTIFRAMFVLTMAAIGWRFLDTRSAPADSILARNPNFFQIIAIVVAVVLVCIDILSPRRKLTIFSGTFLGLVVGMLLTFVLSFIVRFVVELVASGQSEFSTDLTNYLTLLVGACACYLSISFILQTKDDFRFIIPYVEFRKQTKGNRPILLDTSALIDGRIAPVVQTGILQNQLIVPRFVLQELQTIADSADRLKRNRGRRGLDVLAKLQQMPKADTVVYDTSGRDTTGEGVDQRLMQLAKELEARVMTTDFNLNKVAQLAGIDVINLNELASTMRPEVLPGERMTVKLIKAGEGAHQAVGYMDDGTMVVVEQGRAFINDEVEFVVTNTVQTNAGKMIFGRIADNHSAKAKD